MKDILRTGEPRLLSDFDGTAVETVGRLNPRNWLKYPLPMKKGYLDFLDGVQSAGVEVKGIVSCRPDIAMRRIATYRSIAKLGMGCYFDENDVIHATREVIKAGVIVANGLEGPTGTIDDRPHKIGMALLHVMDKMPDTEDSLITLGVVSGKYSDDYVDIFLERVSLQEDWAISLGKEDTYVVSKGSYSISLTKLKGYSQEEGRIFGERIKSEAVV